MTLFSLSPFLNTTDNSVLISKMQQEKAAKPLDIQRGKLGNCVGIRRFRPLSSSPLPYTEFAPTIFEFDPTK